MKDTKELKLFCREYSIKMFFIFFIIGSLIGTYYEEFLHILTHNFYSRRQGLLWGPFNPIYGLGFANFIIFLGKKNHERGIFYTWLLCIFIGGFTEYLESFIFDKLLGIEFWNYTGYFLNIHGRTTIPFMIGWGFGGMILLKIIYPLIYKLLTKIPPNLFTFINFVYYLFTLFLIINITITYSALYRMNSRQQNIPPKTIIAKFYDQHFDDEYLKKKFPSMQPANF